MSLSRPKTGLLLLGAVAACSPRTLALVDLLSDAGLAPASVDANLGDAPDGAAIDGSLGDGPDGATYPTLLRGLVGLWHFDDGVGSKVASDSSGNGNDGTLVDLDPALAWVPGRQGGALDTGGAGYVLVPDSASINGITAQVTVSAWFYFDGVIPVDYGTALSRQMGTGLGQYYHLSLYKDGSPTFFIGLADGVPEARAQGPKPIASRRWIHLAGTYDGSRAALYVNGAEAGSWPISGGFASDTTPVILGGNGNQAEITERFPGSIDEVALYNRALSPQEIRWLATAVDF
jgi:hypothetical protein